MDDSWLGLQDKVIVVTGAGGGMGTKFCHDLAQQGARLVLIDLSAERITDLANELTNQYGVQVLPLVVNVTDEHQVDEAVAKTVATFERVDVVVNTAAILHFSPLEDLSLEEWNKELNVNLTGYFLASQRFGRQMIKQHHGTFVHISTVAAQFPETYSAAYSTTKAGVDMLSKQMAAEWGQFGVRSNCVRPRLVKTPMSAGFYADPKVEQGRSRLVASRRIGNLDDISNTVLFMASDRSDYLNGELINVDGGINVMMQDMIPKPGGRRQYAIDHRYDHKG